jgi:hypothetical protein
MSAQANGRATPWVWSLDISTRLLGRRIEEGVCCVSGHGFSRAEFCAKELGFSPCEWRDPLVMPIPGMS